MTSFNLLKNLRVDFVFWALATTVVFLGIPSSSLGFPLRYHQKAMAEGLSQILMIDLVRFIRGAYEVNNPNT
jgi:hypothetical protein